MSKSMLGGPSLLDNGLELAQAGAEFIPFAPDRVELARQFPQAAHIDAANESAHQLLCRQRKDPGRPDVRELHAGKRGKSAA